MTDSTYIVIFSIGIMIIITIGSLCITVGLWALLTKREKIYKERLEDYIKQKKIVESEMEKRRKENEQN